MRSDRRDVLKAGVLAGLAGVLPAAASAAVTGARGSAGAGRGTSAAPGLVVYDSRIPESRRFAQVQGLDLAHGYAALLAHPGCARIEGLTRWSDYVALRGHFGDRGMRVMREDKIEAPLSGKTHLFRWTMVAR